MIPKDILKYKMKACQLGYGLCTYPYGIHRDICLICEAMIWYRASEAEVIPASERRLPKLQFMERI